ncbi:hypothetical protein CRUP_013552 [Coryphaenoides rupestris]|nr:hypothetical protein CRUP_013552 [Coryphaenoides rupestris]
MVGKFGRWCEVKEVRGIPRRSADGKWAQKVRASSSIFSSSTQPKKSDELIAQLGTLRLTLTSGRNVRVKRSVPNWAMSSSDFFGWVEELRRHAGYEKMDELARTFWAHFPSADRLGYGTHEPDDCSRTAPRRTTPQPFQRQVWT